MMLSQKLARGLEQLANRGDCERTRTFLSEGRVFCDAVVTALEEIRNPDRIMTLGEYRDTPNRKEVEAAKSRLTEVWLKIDTDRMYSEITGLRTLVDDTLKGRRQYSVAEIEKAQQTLAIWSYVFIACGERQPDGMLLRH